MNDNKLHKGLVVLTISIALFGLFGWSTGKLFFAQISVLYIPIAPSTALSFLIISLILLIKYQNIKRKLINSINLILSIIVICFSGIIIVDWLFNFSWDIENVFIKNPEAFGEVVTGRMSPLTALLFILEAFAILLFEIRTSKMINNLFGIIVFISFFSSSILLIGYLYDTPLLYGGHTIPVALPTAICFWLISISIIVAVNFKFWPFSLLIGNTTETKLTKSFLPIILLLLILNSYLNSNVLIKFKNPALTSALVLIIAIILIGIIITFISKSLGRSLEKTKQELKEQNKEYATLNEEYKTTNEDLNKSKIIAEESEKKYKDLFNELPIGAYRSTPSGKFIDINPAMIKILGYPDKETLININAKKLYVDKQERQEQINASLSMIRKGIFERRVYKYDGTIIWVELFASYTYDENGKVMYFYGTVQDITKKKETELELIKAKEKAVESDRLKTEFISNMSHEIRTPMNGILGFSKFLNKENLSSEKRKHHINIIQNSGNQLMRVIDDILEISKLGTNQVKISEKEICLNDLFLELFSVFDIKAKENKTPLYIRKGLSDKDSKIFTDETKLIKILSNLLENSLKFTNTGFIEFGYKKLNSDIEIYVKDTGIGINPDKQDIIFERFSQEEKELSKNVGGLGLGLSIAKENTELLGGKITLESEKGKGATFFVTIPYKPANPDTTKSDFNKFKDKIEHDKFTIIIAEDEEVNFLYIETLLDNEMEIECEILHAKNGKEAIEICKQNTNINLILMDLKMPIMNGFEATKKIKEFRPNLSIVAQTAYRSNEDKEKAFMAGCNDFISKPISEETLNEIINKYLIKSKQRL